MAGTPAQPSCGCFVVSDVEPGCKHNPNRWLLVSFSYFCSLMLRVCFNPADWGLQCHGTNDIRIRLNGGCPTHLVSLLVWVCIGQNWDTNGPTDMRVLLNIIYIYH